MSAPVLQSEGSIAAVTTGSVTVTLPSHQAGDILLLCLIFWGPNTAGDAAQPPLPSGWSTAGAVGSGQPSSAPRSGWVRYFYLRAASSSETNPVCSPGASWDTGTDTVFAGRAWCIRGATSSDPPYEDTAATLSATAANGAFPAMTVSGLRRLVLIVGGMMDDAGFGAAPGGWTAGTQSVTTTGTDAGAQTFRKDDVSADTAADASHANAPAQGGYVFRGYVFIPAAYEKLQPDTVTPSDAQVKAATSHPADSATPSDAIVKGPNAKPADSVTPSDSALRAIGKRIAEAPALVDATQDTIALTKGDSVSLSDARSPIAAYLRSVAETSVSLSDELTTLLGGGLVLSDPVSVADSLAKAIGRSSADSAGLSDGVTRSWGIGLSVQDSLSLADQVRDQIAIIRVELVGLAESVTTLSEFHLGLADSGVLDDLASLRTSKPLSDSVPFTDDQAKTIGFRPSDTAGLFDLIGLRRHQSVGDSISLADAFSKRPGIVRADSIALIDAVRDAIHIMLSEAATAGDSRSAAVSFHRTFSEAPAALDLISKHLGLPLADTIDLLDDSARGIGINIAELLALLDANAITFISAGLRLRGGRPDLPRGGRSAEPRSGTVKTPRTGDHR